MAEHEIRVTLVKYADRRHWMMRFVVLSAQFVSIIAEFSRGWQVWSTPVLTRTNSEPRHDLTLDRCELGDKGLLGRTSCECVSLNVVEDVQNATRGWGLHGRCSGYRGMASYSELAKAWRSSRSRNVCTISAKK